MFRTIRLVMLVVLCIGGYLLTRESAVEQSPRAGLLGSLPSSTMGLGGQGGGPFAAGTVTPPANGGPNPVAGTPLVLAPSAIGAGYGQDPGILHGLIAGAAGSGNPPQAPTMAAATRPRLVRLPAILPARRLVVPILMYHHISSDPPATALNAGLTVTDTAFAAQLAYLHRRGYHTILLHQLFAALYEGALLPPHPIVLTFDDGYLDNYTDALPLLLHAQDVAVFNIISAYVGTTLGVNRYMNWSALRQLVIHGMEIGSHTVDHQDLGALTEVQIRAELRDSRDVLQRRLGVPVQFLAYPSGEPFRSGTPAAQQEVRTLLPQYGYVGALLDGPGGTSVQHAQRPFALSRIRVAGGETLAAFAASL